MTLLTARQEEVMRLLAIHGLQQADAAERMGICRDSVKALTYQVRRRLGARTMTHAVFLWIASKMPKEQSA